MSTWRAPRFQLLANGNRIIGGIRIEVVSNNHYAADRFNGEVSLSIDPAFGLGWWEAQTDIRLEVQMALMADNTQQPAWQSILIGIVDHLQFDVTTQCVRFDGRDLSSLLIEAKTQETFANQTSSEIIQTLASRHGLQADVTPTSTLVGQYYQLDHDRITNDNLSHQTNEWDLATWLAQEEEYDLWVNGNTIFFHPPTANTDPPFQIVYQPPANGQIATLNVERLTLERSLTLAKDIQVTVKSTNLRTGSAYIRIVKAQGAKSPGATKSATQSYVFTRPGLTPDQALKLGNAKLAELTQHERVVSVEMPGELSLTARSKVQISGTNSGFDQMFYCDTITRCIDFNEGMTQHLRLKNSSPRSQTTVL